MRLKFSVLVLAVVLGLGAGTAQAVPFLAISGDPGVLGSIPGPGLEVNDLLDDIYGAGTTSRDGYYGATITLSEPATIYFTYRGKEAGFVNAFGVGALEIFNTGTTPVGTTITMALGAGVLPFWFTVDTGAGSAANCVSGTDSFGHPCNPDNVGSAPNFFTSFSGLGTDTSGTTLILFLDDGGGGPDDDNHDDMAIRISTVPEPGSMLLVGSGLAALWARRRRRA